jgi:FMN-dependent NADH-azoreductase
MNLLYIDASIRPAALSRTHALGEAFLEAYRRPTLRCKAGRSC